MSRQQREMLKLLGSASLFYTRLGHEKKTAYSLVRRGFACLRPGVPSVVEIAPPGEMWLRTH